MNNETRPSRVSGTLGPLVRRSVQPLEDSQRDTSNDWKTCPHCGERSDAWKLFCWKCDHAFNTPNSVIDVTSLSGTKPTLPNAGIGGGRQQGAAAGTERDGE
jgi:ribosomal protein L37AE/L43A